MVSGCENEDIREEPTPWTVPDPTYPKVLYVVYPTQLGPKQSFLILELTISRSR